VRKQPANAATWLTLAEFELQQGNRSQALSAVGSALYLDPRSADAIRTYLAASGQ
jgi:cytochrome c-type biogenesis protein CcmH/NrfG